MWELLRKAALPLLLCLVATGASAQLELLNNLSESQKQALLRQYAEQIPGQVSQKVPEQAPAPTAAVEPLSIDEVAPVDSATGLRPFGYELFAGQPSTFAPATDIPVPQDHVLGPGDTVKLQLYGKENLQYSLTVDRDGNLQIPELGAIGVIGLDFEAMKAQVEELVAQRKIGVSANVTMGALRSIRVFVLGDARQPGAYTVSSLSTMTNALFVSGGIKPIGSLRNIQLKRDGQIVQTLDLYRLLLHGDSRQDARLRPGDVIHIPVAAAKVAVSGAVRRPAIYELDGERTLEEVIALAGGLASEAWRGRVLIERVADEGRRRLLQTDLTARGARLRLQAGDHISVLPALERADNRIELNGHVERTQSLAWGKGLRFTDVIRGPQDLKDRGDVQFALLMRRSENGERLEAHYIHPAAAFAGRGGPEDIALQPLDQLYFFPAYKIRGQDYELASTLERQQALEQVRTRQAEPVSGSAGSQTVASAPLGGLRNRVGALRITSLEPAAPADEQPSAELLASLGLEDAATEMDATKEDASSRARIIETIVADLRAQASVTAPAQIAKVVGAVRFPGEYPLDIDGTSIEGLLRAAGGLADQAFLYEVELTRKVLVGEPEELRATTRQLVVNLAESPPSEHLAQLQPGDVITVRYVPGANRFHEVSIQGEVRFPGTYQISEGEDILNLLQRAGGLTEQAYPYGAVLTRESLKAKEKAQAQKLFRKLQQDLAGASLGSEDAGTAQALLAAQGLLEELRNYEAVGRLVIDLPRMLKGRQPPVRLDDGDQLIIPPQSTEVTVLGEVQFPTSHLYEAGIRRDDYVQLSGGSTELADDDRVYVVKANGQVKLKGGWFSRQPKIDPGDVIVVPLDATPIRPLTLASSVTQIVYQLGLAAAGFKAVGAF